MKKIFFSFILTVSALIFALTPVYANTNKMTVYDVEEQTTLGSANNKIEVNGFYYASEGQILLDEGSPIDIKGTLIEINLTEPVFVYLPEDELTIGNAINKITINIGYYADEAQLTIDNGSPIDIKGHLVYIISTPSDTVRPSISGEENFVTSVDDLRPISFFQGLLSAYDETDGDITASIYIVSDNYTANKSTLGKYEVVFAVKDNAGNETILVSYINVVDITNPVITGNASVAEISYTQTYNISNFKSTLTASDNYYTLTNSNITILSDTYTANKAVPGTYEVVFEVTDSSGNQATFTKPIKVIDDVAPVFSGTTTITKPSNSILAVSEIQAQLTAHDAIEGNKTGQITILSDGYTGKGNVVGSYEIIFQVQDSKGNKSTHMVTVNVVDNIAPVIYIKDGVSIILKANEVLTRDQIISILQVTGQVQNVTQATQFSFLVDEYQGNESTPGVYMLSVRATSVNGNQSVHNMMINVLDADTEDDVTVEPVKLQWYEHIWNFIVDAFSFIWNMIMHIINFFVKAFEWFVGLFSSSKEASLAFKIYNKF